MEQFIEYAQEYYDLAFDAVARPATLYQIGIIILLYVLARLLGAWFEPRLEVWARKIRGMKNLLRYIVGFLRRLRWLFFVLLLALAAEVVSIVAWPESNYLIRTAALLAGAWLVIAVVSHAIRSRSLGRLFALVVWLLVLGFPVAIVLAWAFERTPSGVRRTADADTVELETIAAEPPGRRWPAGLMAVAGVALLLAAVCGWYTGRRTAPTTGVDEEAPDARRAIAVLPINNLS